MNNDGLRGSLTLKLCAERPAEEAPQAEEEQGRPLRSALLRCDAEQPLLAGRIVVQGMSQDGSRQRNMQGLCALQGAHKCSARATWECIKSQLCSKPIQSWAQGS
jgi:hypothetical protein